MLSMDDASKHLQLCSVYSHPRLVTYTFATPPIKLKPGQQTVGGLMKKTTCANHYDRPIRNTEQQLDHILLSSLWVHSTAMPFTSHAIMPTHNRPTLDFLHPILLSRITYWAALEVLLTYYRMRPEKYRWFFWGQNFVILWKLFSKKNIPSQNPCL
jgi:hypothetical protein